jgi:hypothetical protein
LISQNYFQGMMSGLSRVMPYLSTRFLIEIKVSFDAIKLLSLALLNLYECAVSASNADLTL